MKRWVFFLYGVGCYVMFFGRVCVHGGICRQCAGAEVDRHVGEGYIGTAVVDRFAAAGFVCGAAFDHGAAGV